MTDPASLEAAGLAIGARIDQSIREALNKLVRDQVDEDRS
jgi:hypothetical protein